MESMSNFGNTESITDWIGLTRAKVGVNGEDVPHRELILLIDQVTKDFRAELTAAGRSDDFHGLKIIYSVMRFISCDTLEWHFDDCIKLKQEFPHVIAGNTSSSLQIIGISLTRAILKASILLLMKILAVRSCTMPSLYFVSENE